MCKNKGDIMKLTDIKNASDSALFAEKGYDVFGFDREAVRAVRHRFDSARTKVL